MKCEECRTTENVRRVKDIPLPGRNGHITLFSITHYCTACIQKKGAEYMKELDEQRAKSYGTDCPRGGCET